ncbi:MAG: hypothetical protein IH991_19080, partial [Planctomycetes bacterium]|nr:hypothetical protein [Planctomycetota bacterium]
MMRCGVCGVVAMALGGLIAFELTQPLSKGEESKDGMGKIPKHVKDTLEWLPVETETVYVANGPFKLPRVKGERDTGWEARWLPMNLLEGIRKGRYWSLLEGREVLACVEGSCRFRQPRGLGPYFFDGCQVVLLKEALEKGGATFMDRLLDEANGSEVVKGLEVARFEEQLEGGDWKFYVVLIKGKVLLMATSRPYLAGVISRMQGGKGPVFGRGRKEWKHVDGTADAWAIRRLEREGDEPEG